MLIMGIVNSSVKPGTNHAVSSLGQAYWGGLLIIAAGVVGIFYSKKSGHGVLRGWTMALNIVLCFVLFIDMIIFGMGAAFYGSTQFIRTYVYVPGSYGRGAYNLYYKPCYSCSRVYAIYIVCLLICIVEWFISLITACICCCGKSKPAGGVIVMQTQPGASIVSNSGQQQYGYYYPNQPIMYAAADQKNVMMSPQTDQPMMAPHTNQPMYMNQQPQMGYANMGANVNNSSMASSMASPPQFQVVPQGTLPQQQIAPPILMKEKVAEMPPPYQA